MMWSDPEDITDPWVISPRCGERGKGKEGGSEGRREGGRKGLWKRWGKMVPHLCLGKSILWS